MPRTTSRSTAHQRRWLSPLLALLLLGAASVAQAQITTFRADVNLSTVTYTITVEEPGTIDLYYDRSSPPGAGDQGDDRVTMMSTGTTTFQWTAPNGSYSSWAQLRSNPSSPTEPGDVKGPVHVTVGPDLIICSFNHEINGSSIRYKARICNMGTLPAGPLRVGFYYDRNMAPWPGEKEDQFTSKTGLDPVWYIATWPPCIQYNELNGIELSPWYCSDHGQNRDCCPEVMVDSDPLADGLYRSYAMVDSANFVEEAQELNNVAGPLVINLSYPDIVVTRFTAVASDNQVTYAVDVCNRGTAAAGAFYVDVYYDRELPPQVGAPGNIIHKVDGLHIGGCEHLSLLREYAPDGTYDSWVLADADDFLVESDKINNRKGPLEVQVTQGEGCTDADEDGFGVGRACEGLKDCDDADPNRSPGTPETCEDGIDQNCNVTPDDGCPGVECSDRDGDNWPSGPACLVSDCNDSDNEIYPHAEEVCGDGKDNNCNSIIDDGCPGRLCDDEDEDGYGVGEGCPGPQDLDDNDPTVYPGAEEICGDGKDNNCNGIVDDGCPGCTDADGDGYGVGDGCGPLLERDCDDGNPMTFPGSQEICGDGIDTNCNTSHDEGCPGVECTDNDGDGWPDGPDCGPITDPDDTDPTIYPGAPEVCGDGIDQNGNNTPDDGCPGVDCIDLDGDNWPSGSECESSDCDDTDASISPVTPEICADGIDQDCDGTADDGCRSCEDRDGDGFSTGPDCPVEAPQDCDDDNSHTYPGAPASYQEGADSNCNGIIDPEEEAPPPGCDCEDTGAEDDGGLPETVMAGLVLVGVWRRRSRRRRRR